MTIVSQFKLIKEKVFTILVGRGKIENWHVHFMVLRFIKFSIYENVFFLIGNGVLEFDEFKKFMKALHAAVDYSWFSFWIDMEKGTFYYTVKSINWTLSLMSSLHQSLVLFLYQLCKYKKFSVKLFLTYNT